MSAPQPISRNRLVQAWRNLDVPLRLQTAAGVVGEPAKVLCSWRFFFLFFLFFVVVVFFFWPSSLLTTFFPPRPAGVWQGGLLVVQESTACWQEGLSKEGVAVDAAKLL